MIVEEKRPSQVRSVRAGVCFQRNRALRDFRHHGVFRVVSGGQCEFLGFDGGR
jgi:hypothetical protein